MSISQTTDLEAVYKASDRAESSNGVMGSVSTVKVSTPYKNKKQAGHKPGDQDFASKSRILKDSHVEEVTYLKTSSDSAGPVLQGRHHGAGTPGDKPRRRPSSAKRVSKSRPTSTGALTAAFQDLRAQAAGARDAGRELQGEIRAPVGNDRRALCDYTEEEFLEKQRSELLSRDRARLEQLAHQDGVLRTQYEKSQARAPPMRAVGSTFTFFHHEATTLGWKILGLVTLLLALCMIQYMMANYFMGHASRQVFLTQMGVSRAWLRMSNLNVTDVDCHYNWGEPMWNGELSQCWSRASAFVRLAFVIIEAVMNSFKILVIILVSLSCFCLSRGSAADRAMLTLLVSVATALLVGWGVPQTKNAVPITNLTNNSTSFEKAASVYLFLNHNGLLLFWNLAWYFFVSIAWYWVWFIRGIIALVLLRLTFLFVGMFAVQVLYVKTSLTYLQVVDFGHLDGRLVSSQTREVFGHARRVRCSLYVGYGYWLVDWLCSKPGLSEVVVHEQLLQEALGHKFDVPGLSDKDLWDRLNELGRLNPLYNGDSRLTENDLCGDTIRTAWAILTARRRSRVNKGSPVGF